MTVLNGTISCNPDGGTANQCPSDLPFCHPTAHICVGCTDDFQTCDSATYGPGMTCDPVLHKCVPAPPDAGCKRTSDCPRPGVDPSDAIQCEVELGVCVGCVSNNDCVQPQTCDPSTQKCANP
jgi:hypothetical protein